jgi:cobalt transporter subunit CbtB
MMVALRENGMRKLTAANSAPDAVRSAGALVASVTAVLLGAFLLLGVGFAPIAVAHNAAHDARHSFAFPCH